MARIRSTTLTAGLLTNNPNQSNLQRLDRSIRPLTCDQKYGYTAEQTAFDNGLMDKLVQSTGTSFGTCS